MLAAKRRARILQYLRSESFASLNDLADRLDMSVSTIRRDLDYLDQTGHLVRTRGGAMLDPGMSELREVEADISAEIEATAKRAIGQAAARMIAPGSSVIFDSGTTTAAVARAAIAEGRDFSSFTNDLTIAGMLAQAGYEVEMPGGRVRPGSSTLIGATCVRAIARLRPDIAFIGAHAVCPEGLSDSTTELAEVKAAILAAGRKTMLVADATKFDSRSYCLFGGLDRLQRVFSDSRLGPASRRWIERAGPQLDLQEVTSP